jgi:2-dehydropantoate 2-reductase
MRYLVLGAGALGGYFGATLLKGGADVTFLVRPPRAAQLRRDGLVIKAPDGSELRSPVRTVEQGQLDGHYDVVLLTCKAYDLESALAAIAPAVGEQSAIVPVLNGIRHIDDLTERFGRGRVLGGLTRIRAELMRDGTIAQSRAQIDFNLIGELDGRASTRCSATKAALEAGGMPVDISDDIMAMMWAKFFGFVCSATIATLTRSRAGPLARSASGARFVSAVIEECARVVAAAGYPQAPPPAPDTAAIIRGLFSGHDSSYGPSMLIDMEQGRRTEGEHTIGDMVERADRANISAPILNAARCNLEAYEINRTRPR